jgi:hypothetical protein
MGYSKMLLILSDLVKDPINLDRLEVNMDACVYSVLILSLLIHTLNLKILMIILLNLNLLHYMKYFKHFKQ